MFNDIHFSTFYFTSILILNFNVYHFDQKDLHRLAEAELAVSEWIDLVDELLVEIILVLQMNVVEKLLEFADCFQAGIVVDVELLELLMEYAYVSLVLLQVVLEQNLDEHAKGEGGCRLGWLADVQLVEGVAFA